MAGNEMSDDFRVGVAGEGDALLLKAALEHGVVLDDAVMDHDYGGVAAAGDVGVGVDIVGGAVGCPAGVGDAELTGGRPVAQEITQPGNASGALTNV
jgi:hypothetical protein